MSFIERPASLLSDTTVIGSYRGTASIYGRSTLKSNNLLNPFLFPLQIIENNIRCRRIKCHLKDIDQSQYVIAHIDKIERIFDVNWRSET